MKTLALFDFDKTLYEKDSLLEFTKFSKGKTRFLIGLIIISPYLLLMKFGIISNEKAKKKYIHYFFNNTQYDEFNKDCMEFSLNKIDQNINPKIYSSFINHVKLNHQIYIVTASMPEWIEPWGNQFGVEVIGTIIEIKNNKITGEFTSKNCYGIEKVNRINSILDLDEFDKILVYGSGKGDREMLQISKIII